MIRFNVSKALATHISILFLLISSYAQAIEPPYDAVSQSLGGSVSTSQSSFSTTQNPACLWNLDSRVTLLANNNFGISSFSTAALAWNNTFNKTAIGASLHYDISNNLGVRQASLAVAKQLNSSWEIGISLDLANVRTLNSYYSNRMLFKGSLGLNYHPSENLTIGFLAKNPNRSVLSSFPFEESPSVYRLGAKYTISQNLTGFAELSQHSYLGNSTHFGLALQHKQFQYRFGLQNSKIPCFGIGRTFRNLTLDLAIKVHNQLGVSPFFALHHAI